MKKNIVKDGTVVQDSGWKENSRFSSSQDAGYVRKAEKIWLIDYYEVRRHSHTLYLPLNPVLVRLHKIKVGDEIKAILLGVVSPEEKRKIWVIKFFQVHRHSRILYLPLDSLTVKQHGIKKGDVVKVQLLENRPAPPSEGAPTKVEQGEL